MMNRQECIDSIQYIANRYGKDAKLKNFVLSNIKDRVSVLKVTNLLNDKIQAIMLYEHEMYFLMKEFYDFFIESRSNVYRVPITSLKVERYFTPIEIQEFEEMPTIDRESLSEYVFRNVRQISHRQWDCLVTAKELVQLVNNNFIVYDYEMQREREVVEKYGLIYERAKIFKKSVLEIYSLMAKNLYFSTTLSLNITKDGQTDFYYDSENNEITIYQGGRNALIDGFHRYLAMFEGIKNDENFDYVMKLNIFNVSVPEAQLYIRQEAMKNAISKELIQKYNMRDVYTILGNEINNDGDMTSNLMYQKMAGTSKELENPVTNKLVTVEKFVDTIKSAGFVLEENNMINRRRLKTFLIDFYNELFSILHEEYSNIVQAKKEGGKLHHNTFYMYNRIACRLQDVSNWRDILPGIVEDVWNDRVVSLVKMGKDKKARQTMYELVDKTCEIYTGENDAPKKESHEE